MRLIVAFCGLAILGLILVSELMGPDGGGPEADADRVRPPDTAAVRTPKPGSPNPGFDAGALGGVAAAIVERPLFSPDRRPAGDPAVPAARVAAAEGDALPRLTGVIVGPSGARAIFAGADGKSHAAAEGDTVGAFKVRTIGPGLVTLSGSEGDRVLRPAYVTATTAGTTTTGTTAATRPGERPR